MKTLFYLLVFFPFVLFSQIKKPISRKCYEKDNEAKTTNRFSSWECGKTAGVVDCNDKLEYD